MTDDCKYGGRDTRLRLLIERAYCTAASAESIALDYVVPCNCVMVQIVAHWAAIPAASEDISLWKESAVDARLDTVLAAMDPSPTEYNTKDWVCTIPFFWPKGDHVRIDYNNTNDQNVGVEIILQQVIGGV